MVFYFSRMLTKQNTKRTSFDYSIIVNKCISLEVQHIFYHLRLSVIASDLLGFFCSTVVKCLSFQSDLIWNNVFAIRDEPDLFGVWRWLSCKFCVGSPNPLKSFSSDRQGEIISLNRQGVGSPNPLKAV